MGGERSWAGLSAPESKVSSLDRNPSQRLTCDPELQRSLSGIPHFSPTTRAPVSPETQGSSTSLGGGRALLGRDIVQEEAFILHKVPR